MSTAYSETNHETECGHCGIRMAPEYVEHTLETLNFIWREYPDNGEYRLVCWQCAVNYGAWAVTDTGWFLREGMNIGDPIPLTHHDLALHPLVCPDDLQEYLGGRH